MKNLICRSLVVLSLFSAALVQADGEEKYELYFSTRMKGKLSTMTVRVGGIDIDHLEEQLDEFQTADGVTILPAKTKTINIVIVVPKNAKTEARQAVGRRISEAVGKQFPNHKIEVQESFVDIEADNEALAARRQALAEIITQIRNGDPGERETLLLADKILALGEDENRRFLASWHPNLHGISHPYNQIIGARIIAVTKLGISFTLVLTKYGINPGSLLVGATSGGIAATFGYNANRWSDFCGNHTIPGFPTMATQTAEGEEITGLSRGARVAYNTLVPKNPLVGGLWNVIRYPYNRWAPAELKSATVNLIRTFGVDFIVRGLAYSTGQVSYNRNSGEYESVQSPVSWEFLRFGGLLNTLELIGDAAMDAGSQRSEMKRHYSALTRSYMLWIIGLLDTSWHALFRVQADEWALGIGLVSFGMKCSLYAISWLPERGPRFVFVSDAVGTEAGFQELKRPGFFGYFQNMFGNIKRTIVNSLHGRFSVSDRTMVNWHLGGKLEQAINLELSDEKLQRLANDPNLQREEFISFLNLNKAPVRLVEKMWNYRNAHLGQEGLTPAAICTASVATENKWNWGWFGRFFGSKGQQ